MVRWFVMLLLCLASPIAAQVAPVPTTAIQVTPPLPSAAPPLVTPPPPPPPILGPTPGYYPAYDYITIGQDEPTSVVWGMPAAAQALGAVEVELPLSQIAAALTSAVCAEGVTT